MSTVKLLLSLVIILTLGVIVLPSTTSLFLGQHTWYDIDKPANDIPCVKCHADVADELRSDPYHRGFSKSGDINKDCEVCHRGLQITYASGNKSAPGKEAHAATTVSCLLCHSGYTSNTHPGTPNNAVYEGSLEVWNCSKCHGPGLSAPPPIAGGFGLTGQNGDTGELEAHKKFVLEAKNSSLMMDYNEACIACHTHVRVKINWTHAYSLEFNATKEFLLTGGNTTHFNVTDWKINGSVVVTVYGNGTQGSTTGWP